MIKRAQLLVLLVLVCCAPPPKSTVEAPGKSASSSAYSGPIIDVHCHVRLTDDDPAVTANQPSGSAPIRALDERSGVVHSSLILMARKGEVERTRKRNDALVAMTRESSDFFFPAASVHPDDGDAALQELDRLASLGVRLIKLHPVTQHFDVASSSVAALAARAEKHRLIFLFDASEILDVNQTGKFLTLAIEHPELRIILAHLGFTHFHDMAAFGMMRVYPFYKNNVWFDLSGIAAFYADSPYREQLVWVIRKIGTDRILFGSDYPVHSPQEAIGAVHRLGLERAEEERIFYSNAKELFELR